MSHRQMHSPMPVPLGLAVKRRAPTLDELYRGFTSDAGPMAVTKIRERRPTEPRIQSSLNQPAGGPAATIRFGT